MYYSMQTIIIITNDPSYVILWNSAPCTKISENLKNVASIAPMRSQSSLLYDHKNVTS